MATSKKLVLEWDRQELRVLVLDGGGRRSTVEGAYVFAFEQPGRPEDAAELAEFLRASLASAGIGAKAVTAVAMPGEVLLRHLRLPPAPDDEIPGMVRFQASGELTATLEGAGLDYTLLRTAGEEQKAVLAAVLPAASMQQYEQVLSGAGLSAQHIVLRGQASAESLREHLRRRAGSTSAPSANLLVDFTADAVCLSVLVNGDCVLTRWRRLPGGQPGEEPGAAFVAGEMARTLTAFHAQFPTSNVEGLFLAGGPNQRPLVDDVSQTLGRKVQLLDPLDVLGGSEAARTFPERHGRFCALAGVALWESRGAQPPLDFLHPKEPMKRAGRNRRLAAAIGAGAAVLLLGTMFWYGIRHRALTREITTLQDEIDRLDGVIGQYGDVDRDSKAIEEWKQYEVVWLDELYEITRRFPAAEEAHVSKLDLLPNSGRLESRMRVAAEASSEDVVEDFHSAMSRDRSRYVVHPESVQKQASSQQYSWQFQSVIEVNPRGDDEGQTAPAARRDGARRSR